MRHLLLAFSFIVTGFQPAFAQEYFGTFPADPVGTFVSRQPRPAFRLGKAFSFSDPNGLEWAVPADSEVDGASIPQAFWSLIGGPFEGEYLSASIIHDHYCRLKTRRAEDTHRNFYYGMRARGVSEWKAEAMYWAVKTFGPDWTIERRVIYTQDCQRSAGGGFSCRSIPKFVDQAVEANAVDLSDPAVLAVAQAKLSTIISTLQATDGAQLDSSDTGRVAADLESIDSNSARYRALLANRTFETDPSAMGLLAEWQPEKLEDWRAVRSDQIPSSNHVREFFAQDPDANLDEPVVGAGRSPFYVLRPEDVPGLDNQPDLGVGTYDLEVDG